MLFLLLPDYLGFQNIILNLFIIQFKCMVNNQNNAKNQR